MLETLDIMRLLEQLPNLAVAVWSLWWSFRRLEVMLEVHDRFVERLFALLTDEQRADLRASWREHTD
jgi:hypothetical protein